LQLQEYTGSKLVPEVVLRPSNSSKSKKLFIFVWYLVLLDVMFLTSCISGSRATPKTNHQQTKRLFPHSKTIYTFQINVWDVINFLIFDNSLERNIK
jgi:hypothetical protein